MSAELDNGVRFTGGVINWESPSGLLDGIAQHSPRLVFHTASLQSPWELLGDVPDTPWKRLVWSAGIAITLPMQALLAWRVATAVRRIDPAPLLVNACCPDWVNPMLRQQGLPVTCGTGNIAMFTGFLKVRYPPPMHRVWVIGHLYHFFKIMGKPHSDIQGPRVWLDGIEVPDVEVTLSDCFGQLREVNAHGKIINELVGAASAQTLLGLLADEPLNTHVPGPNGLPGGYPVSINKGRLELDLPLDCSLAEAIDLNLQGAYDMGAAIIDPDGFTAFSPTAQYALAEYVPALAEGFHIEDLSNACAKIVQLRTELVGSG
jgi:hypothetical protein